MLLLVQSWLVVTAGCLATLVAVMGVQRLARIASRVGADRDVVEDGDLGYAIDLAAVDQPLPPHRSASLRRIHG